MAVGAKLTFDELLVKLIEPSTAAPALTDAKGETAAAIATDENSVFQVFIVKGNWILRWIDGRLFYTQY